jgi:methyl-accepting chemotaxis protein
MSEGDLTNPIIITSHDEIQTIAEFVDNVRKSTVKTLGALKKSSETVAERIGSLSLLSQELAESSEEVSTTINELADGNNIQSEEISKTNAIINNLGIKINEIVLSNENVNSKIQVINSNANISKNDLLLLEKAITEINLSFKDVKCEINELSVYLLKINEITKLIDHISQQTNILALNAAIEAARAGEVGKSFAVVADEVKNLALQTKDSALDISSLLENVMNKSNNVIKTSDNMDNKLSLQIEVIKNSINSFKEIIDEIDKVIPTVVDVSNNMKEIDAEQGNVINSIEATAAISEQVSASSEQISATAQQLSLSSQKVAISAQNLNELSTDMINSINYFKI